MPRVRPSLGGQNRQLITHVRGGQPRAPIPQIRSSFRGEARAQRRGEINRINEQFPSRFKRFCFRFPTTFAGVGAGLTGGFLAWVTGFGALDLIFRGTATAMGEVAVFLPLFLAMGFGGLVGGRAGYGLANEDLESSAHRLQQQKLRN